MTPRSVRSVGGLVLLASCVLVVLSLLLAMHFEATPRALEDAAKGQAVGIPAGFAAVAALVAMSGARRRWGTAVLALAVVLTVVSVVLYAVK